MAKRSRSVKKRMAKGKKKPKKGRWPQERAYMARPERYNYVRNLIKRDGCVFCEARDTAIGFPNLLVHTTPYSMVVLNKFPYNSGHIMVLPKRHCGSLTELNRDEYNDLAGLLRLTARAVEEEYQCKGMNVGMNMGDVAGAGIPAHLHWHVIPRWKGDTNFFPLIAETKVLPETLEQTFKRYVARFEALKNEFEAV